MNADYILPPHLDEALNILLTKDCDTRVEKEATDVLLSFFDGISGIEQLNRLINILRLIDGVTLSTQFIKCALSVLKKDRTWFAENTFCSINTVNGWLSAGKNISLERELQFKSVLHTEAVTQRKELERINLEENKEEPTPIKWFCIIPKSESSRLLWNAVFDQCANYQHCNYDLTDYALDVIHSVAKTELKSFLLDNPSTKLKNIHVASAETSNSSLEAFRQYKGEDIYLWRLAAGVKKKTLEEWVNEVLDEYANEQLIKQIMDEGKTSHTTFSPDDDIPF